jgi:hypothetical protein
MHATAQAPILKRVDTPAVKAGASPPTSPRKDPYAQLAEKSSLFNKTPLYADTDVAKAKAAAANAQSKSPPTAEVRPPSIVPWYLDIGAQCVRASSTLTQQYSRLLPSPIVPTQHLVLHQHPHPPD